MNVYKKINPSYINLNQYEVNKQYDIPIDNLLENNINIYAGEYINNIDFFDILNDDKTTNNEYRRLIFSSIKHLYYQNYFFNNFISSSIYDNYLQTTLSSGSYTTNLRKIGNISSSYGTNNVLYNNNNLYNTTGSYYDINRGSLITIISVDKKKYGNNIKPNSFIIENSNVVSNEFYIRDDGEGNLFNYINYNNYLEKIQNNIPGEIYIGNIIYSHGIIIITNPNYRCILGSPPVAVNNYYSYYNIDQPFIFDITANDYSDCDGINYSSIQLITSSNSLDCFINNNGYLQIIENQNNFIPGNYQIEYTINSNSGIQSNIGLIDINILEYPLEIRNFTSSLLCYGNSGSINYSFNIYGGTPEYSYSWDNINYINISGFYNINVTSSISSSQNILYVKDYQNKIISKSIDFHYPEIDYNIITTNGSLQNGLGTLNISSSNGLYYYFNNGDVSQYDTNIIYNISTGSYTASITDINNCTKEIQFNINSENPIIYNLLTQSISCNMGNNGIININNIQGGTNNLYNITISSGSYITSSQNIINLNNLYAGEYNIDIEDVTSGYITSSIITLIQPTSINISLTSSYEFNCYSSIYINVTGGLPPYNYEIISPSSIYFTQDMIGNKIDFQNDGLSNFNPIVKITDSNNCISSSSIEIYKREYIYSGSYCEI